MNLFVPAYPTRTFLFSLPRTLLPIRDLMIKYSIGAGLLIWCLKQRKWSPVFCKILLIVLRMEIIFMSIADASAVHSTSHRRSARTINFVFPNDETAALQIFSIDRLWLLRWMTGKYMHSGSGFIFIGTRVTHFLFAIEIGFASTESYTPTNHHTPVWSFAPQSAEDKISVI